MRPPSYNPMPLLARLLLRSGLLFRLRFLQRRFPELANGVRRHLFRTHVARSRWDDYLRIPMDGFDVMFYKPPLLDHRGIGRISGLLLDALKRRASNEGEDRKNGPASGEQGKRVYYYAAPNYAPEILVNPNVLLVHDTIPLDFPELFPEKIVTRWRKEIKAILSQSTRIVTVSKSTSRDIAKHFSTPLNDITEIYGAVSTFPSGEKYSHKKNSRDYFVYVGTLDPHKNFDVILKSFALPALHTRFDLLVLGDHKGRKDTISGADAERCIRFPGRVRDGKLAAIIEGAQALLLPSYKEGFGLPPLEAAQLGTPSLCSARPAMTEILEGAACFLDPDDPEEWARAMLKIADDAPYREMLVTAARERAKEFTIERMVDRLLPVLREAAGVSKNPPCDGAHRQGAGS